MRAAISSAGSHRVFVIARTLIFLIAAGGLLPRTTAATPVILEPRASLSVPNPIYRRVASVAMDGDSLVMAAERTRFVPEQEDDVIDIAVYLFQRAPNGTWQRVQTLMTDSQGQRQVSVAIRGGIIAVHFDQLFVFERGANGWQTAPVDRNSEYPNADRINAQDIEIDGGTIIIGYVCNAFEVRGFRKNAFGAWARVGTAVSDPAGCSGGLQADVAISGNTTLLSAEFLADRTSADYFLDGTSGSWTVTERIAGHGRPVAIEQNLAILTGTELFRRTSGAWAFKQTLERADREMFLGLGTTELRNKIAAVSFGPTVSIFQGDVTDNFSEVARLTRPGGDLATNSVDISGRRIVANDIFEAKAHIYELPTTLTQPTSIQETFQVGNAANWTPLAGSSWSVVTTPASRVYRQASVAGEAGSILSGADWTNQSIQVDVQPTLFSGADRWFGVAVRRADAANYYYLTARSSNMLQLKKMVNGVFQTLGSVSLPVTLNSSYRLRQEAIGTTLRAFVDDRKVIQVVDSSLTHGHAGLLMYKVAAEFDNVVVTPSPQVTLADDTFEQYLGFRWMTPTGQWSVTTPEPIMYVQNSDAGNATMVAGVPTDDQSIQARMQATGFGAGSGRWFGLLTRYQDANNYYYVTLRNDHQISLRKLVNGAIQVLDTAPFTVAVGDWYNVRLEVIKNQLRVYADGRLVLEASDSSFARGKYGAVMYKATANYDDVLVTQP